MSIDQLVEKLDFSHCYTTDKRHCIGLYHTALLAMQHEGEVIEIGSFMGISSACIALACQEKGRKLLAYDLCDEISNETREKLWGEVGVANSVIATKGTCRSVVEAQFAPTFIFHDAEHGEHVFPEYDALWGILKPGGVLCIHDAERIPKEKWDTWHNCDYAVFDTDAQNRMMAIFHKRLPE
jgi:predicted O-methyltransferase YrrM